MLVYFAGFGKPLLNSFRHRLLSYAFRPHLLSKYFDGVKNDIYPETTEQEVLYSKLIKEVL